MNLPPHPKSRGEAIEQLGMTNACEILTAPLAEEETTDKALSALGRRRGVNERAMLKAA